jgi:ELWxxDGT repeat protein
MKIYLAHATLLLTMLCCAGHASELVKDINEQPAVRAAGTRILGRVGSDVIFSAGYQFFPTTFPVSDASLGLWRSDGTAAGTRRLFANGVPPAFSSPQRLASGASHVWWIAADPADETTNARRPALWASDGTVAGTTKLAELLVSYGLNDSIPASVLGVLPGDVLVFGTTADLWRSDGTVAGTWRLATFPVGAGVRLGDRIYFAGRGAEGSELWVTDGSNVPANTHLVADLDPGSGSSDPGQFTAVGSDLYFVASTGGVRGLWRRDAVGNIELLTATAPPSIQCVAGNFIYFTLDTQPRQFWRTDGTAAGTLLLLTPTNASGRPALGACKSRGDRVFFPVYSGGLYQLWQSDGTVAGTLATSFSQGSASMRLLHWSGTHWLVATANNSNQFLEQLWATDGASDTRLVPTDVPAGENYFITFDAAGLGPQVLFTTRFIGFPLGSSPSSPLPPAILQLWRAAADGSNPLRLAPDVYGTTVADSLIAAEAGEFLLTDQRLFYRSTDELSVTDGTPGGTTVVRQLVPNGTGNSFSREFATAGSATLFLADDGLTGPELWRTDGTGGGTTQVMDIRPGSTGSLPANLRVVDNLIYFDADDGVHGRELWLSDGTTTGTRMIADTLPDAGWTFDDCPSRLKFNGFVYFGARNNAGPELWRTDGTAAGTTLFLKTGQPGNPQICPQPLAVVGSTLYVAANGFLWRTDGSTGGTQTVPGFSGPIQLFPSLPAQFRGELVVASLSAQFGNSGRTSLWSVGSAGPRLVIDLADPALGSGGPAQIAWVVAVDNTLYFAVTGASSNPGTGLYKWTGGSASPERFSDINAGWVRQFGSRIVFNGWSAATGEEVFISDGSAAGTSAITDLSAAGEFHVHGPALVLGPALYFQYVDTISGPTQVARSNGTLASFERLTDLVWGNGFPLGSADGQLIFAADDVRETVGNELYVVRNQKPIAGADSATVAAGQSVAIALAANDSDTDGQVIASGARVVAAPAHGAVTIKADGTATYQANANFGGTDTFSYVAADNGGRESAPATVTITVQGPRGGSATGSSSGGGGSSGWLLILTLGLLRRRKSQSDNQAADSGV